MPYSVVKQLVRYRSLFVAIANGVITWIILIIAPLGLFAVIICTAVVFFSSLILGTIADYALLVILKQGGWELEASLEEDYIPESDLRPIRTQQRKSIHPQYRDRDR